MLWVVSARLPWDLVSAGQRYPGSDKVCYWQHLEKCKQTIRGQRDARVSEDRELLHCLIVVITLADVSFVTSLSHWHLISTHQRLKSYLNTVTMLHANPIDAAICAAGPFYSHYLWPLIVSPLSHTRCHWMPMVQIIKHSIIICSLSTLTSRWAWRHVINPLNLGLIDIFDLLKCE